MVPTAARCKWGGVLKARNRRCRSLPLVPPFGRPTGTLLGLVHTLQPMPGGDMKGEHHWTNVKKVERVYQKLKRSYNRRCHRAFVIVRSTLIFDDLSGIAKTLGAITNDVNRVTVLRVKNRYDPSFVRTDGYRDVALLLTGPALQNFVCELQLDLRVMFEVKQAGGRGTN
jgi:hypothetical protein